MKNQLDKLTIFGLVIIALTIMIIVNPLYFLYVPSIVSQLIANEGNGIVCVDACGPCSSWGYQYILVNDECVLPSEESCKLFKTPGDWKFVEWTCLPNLETDYEDDFEIDYTETFD